jgi:putative thiamine transport system ATP-binding protein
MPDGRLELCDVTLELAGRPVIAGLSLSVGASDLVTVMGPSGSGKSSLLAFVCGTLDPAFRCTGSVRLDGIEIGGLPPERRRVGILFQDDLLFPHLSVAENLAFGLPAAIAGRPARAARIDQALAEADLAGFGGRDPATLSGGQRARVALLRTLLAEPRALLLDEPFAKLDVALRDRFRRFVFDHARAQGLPTLLVTHDPADAEAAAGPVVELAAAGAGATTRPERAAAHREPGIVAPKAAR